MFSLGPHIRHCPNISTTRSILNLEAAESDTVSNVASEFFLKSQFPIIISLPRKQEAKSSSDI